MFTAIHTTVQRNPHGALLIMLPSRRSACGFGAMSNRPPYSSDTAEVRAHIYVGTLLVAQALLSTLFHRFSDQSPSMSTQTKHIVGNAAQAWGMSYVTAYLMILPDGRGLHHVPC